MINIEVFNVKPDAFYSVKPYKIQKRVDDILHTKYRVRPGVYTIHTARDTHKQTILFGYRVDDQPWVKAAKNVFCSERVTHHFFLPPGKHFVWLMFEESDGREMLFLEFEVVTPTTHRNVRELPHNIPAHARIADQYKMALD